MSMTIERQDRAANAEILVVSSTMALPAYRVFRDGVFVGRTHSNVIVVPLPIGGSVEVEIRDDALPAGTSAESFVVLQWDAIAGTDYYRVERFDDPDWILLDEVYDDGSPEYQWQSPQLGIETSVQFRITPVGTNGNVGTPVTPTVTIAAPPAPPDVTYTFSGATKKVTIAAA